MSDHDETILTAVMIKHPISLIKIKPLLLNLSLYSEDTMLRTQRKTLPLWGSVVTLLVIFASSCNPDSDAVRNSTDVAEACGESDSGR